MESIQVIEDFGIAVAAKFVDFVVKRYLKKLLIG
jgi:hypothetical protein